MLLRVLLVLLALVAAPLATAQEQAIVREQRRVPIGGSQEVWRLVWRGAPHDSSSCGPAEPDQAATCPCSGAAYAQVGDLVLERTRPGAPPEHLPLAPLFVGSELVAGEKAPGAVLARWPMRLHDVEQAPTAAAIRARPAVPVMRLRDYNHDGLAAEFLLQVDTAPCGKHASLAIGITRDNPHLHALTSAEHPERPLALYTWQWDALARNAHAGQVIDWPCGDHGAEEQTSVVLRADAGRIHATRVTSTCPDGAASAAQRHSRVVGKLLKREVL